MNWLQRTLMSSLGLKYIMAITGVLLVGFLVAHLSGNLLVFAGADAFNTYAAKIKSLGPLLWVARIGLLVLAVTHIVAAVKLTAKNKAARPIPYAHSNTIQASYASRTMPISGLIVLCFIIYHLAHFTLHFVDSSYATMHDEQGRHDAFRMLVTGFSNPIAAGFYIIGMGLIGLHLSHGLLSFWQSLGLNHRNFYPYLKCGGKVVAWLLALGFISIPVSVLTGVVRLAEGAQ